MKKALHINNGEYINMCQITDFTITENSIELNLADCAPLYLGTKTAQTHALSFSCPLRVLDIQELKRIKRELETFMGIS